MKFAEFYEGHRASVLKLVGNPKESYFYSTGADGLLVKWNLLSPNQGDVISRLKGFVADMQLLDSDHLLVALNHKGLYKLNANTGTTINFCDLASVSVKKILAVANYVLVLTTKGELLWVDNQSFAIAHRWQGQTSLFDVVCVGKTIYMNTAQGIMQIPLPHKVPKLIFALVNVFKLETSGLLLWAFTPNKVVCIGLKSNDIKNQFSFNIENQEKIWTHATNNFVSIIKFNDKLYKQLIVQKQKITATNTGQNPHNASINHLIWIENYKFAITAGSDAKIGVWKCN